VARVPKVVFATCAADRDEACEAVLLASSVRTFGGALRSGTLRVLRPAMSTAVDERLEGRLAAMGAETVSFTLDDDEPDVPYAAKVAAAALAEAQADGEADLLVWMDPDTLVLQEPDMLLLPEGAVVGWRPVHHRLVGSPIDEPPDPFWSLVYERLGVEDEAVFSVTTAVDGRRIRPYFNAGLLVVRPQAGILRRWHDAFARLCDDAALRAFFIEDPLYHTFFHQAVLAACLLAAVPRSEMLELPPLANYPLHLLESIPAERRPWSLNDLVTCRYDSLDVLLARGWRAILRVDEPLAGWLDDQGAEIGRLR
jgi:hypothetical protein